MHQTARTHLSDLKPLHARHRLILYAAAFPSASDPSQPYRQVRKVVRSEAARLFEFLRVNALSLEL